LVEENWIWRAPVPAIGCLNPGIGGQRKTKTEPKQQHQRQHDAQETNGNHESSRVLIPTILKGQKSRSWTSFTDGRARCRKETDSCLAARLQRSEVRQILIDYWMGHSNPSMGDRYGKQLVEDVNYRQDQIRKVGLGFELPESLFGLRGLQILEATAAA